MLLTVKKQTQCNCLAELSFWMDDGLSFSDHVVVGLIGFTCQDKEQQQKRKNTQEQRVTVEHSLGEVFLTL